jgi:hypothetical protein
MRWFVMITVLVVLTVGLVCFWHERLVQQAQISNYVLQVDNKYLGCNEDCVLEPLMTDEGWASAEIRANPELYRFDAQQANGKFEKVNGGKATLTTFRSTNRIVMVYRKGEAKPFSVHLITIKPRG